MEAVPASLFALAAAEEGELTLLPGALVRDIQQVDEGWWLGTADDADGHAHTGLFPSNYVQLID